MDLKVDLRCKFHPFCEKCNDFEFSGICTGLKDGQTLMIVGCKNYDKCARLCEWLINVSTTRLEVNFEELSKEQLAEKIENVFATLEDI